MAITNKIVNRILVPLKRCNKTQGAGYLDELSSPTLHWIKLYRQLITAEEIVLFHFLFNKTPIHHTSYTPLFIKWCNLIPSPCNKNKHLSFPNIVKYFNLFLKQFDPSLPLLQRNDYKYFGKILYRYGIDTFYRKDTLFCIINKDNCLKALV